MTREERLAAAERKLADMLAELLLLDREIEEQRARLDRAFLRAVERGLGVELGPDE